MKPTNNTVTCDLCHKQFAVTASALEEKELYLVKEDPDRTVIYKCLVTFLTCPYCGKQYPVVLDDAETLGLLEISKDLYQRRMKWVQRGKAVPMKLQEKFEKARRKLGISRQKLAQEYNGSFYQLEDGTIEQLEFCYRER